MGSATAMLEGRAVKQVAWIEGRLGGERRALQAFLAISATLPLFLLVGAAFGWIDNSDIRQMIGIPLTLLFVLALCAWLACLAVLIVLGFHGRRRRRLRKTLEPRVSELRALYGQGRIPRPLFEASQEESENRSNGVHADARHLRAYLCLATGCTMAFLELVTLALWAGTSLVVNAWIKANWASPYELVWVWTITIASTGLAILLLPMTILAFRRLRQASAAWRRTVLASTTQVENLLHLAAAAPQSRRS